MSITGGTWTISWPWPQVFFGQYYTLGLCVEAGALKLYEMYCDTSDDWQAEDAETVAATAANVDSVSIAMIDRFYALGYIYDSGAGITVASFIRNPGTVAPLRTSMPTDKIPKFGTCCAYENQLLIGCIDKGSDDNFGDMGYNSVAWSGIGRADFRIGKDRTAGYHHMPWGEWQTGMVYSIKRLGGQVIAYGDGGIAALTPAGTAYGLKKLHSLGIPSGRHVAGNEYVHGFINTRNEFWVASASADLTKASKVDLQKIGYKEFIEDLTESEVKVSYEAKRKRFYISDSSTCYCITEHGAYSCDQLVTSVGDYRGTLCGFWSDSGDDEVRLTTDTFDFGIRALKTLSTLEAGNNYYSLDGADPRYLQAAVQGRYEYQKNKDDFEDGNWVELNPMGNATIMMTANEFRARIKGETYHDAVVNIDSLKARIKLSDKRGIRGLYGTAKTTT